MYLGFTYDFAEPILYSTLIKILDFVLDLENNHLPYYKQAKNLSFSSFKIAASIVWYDTDHDSVDIADFFKSFGSNWILSPLSHSSENKLFIDYENLNILKEYFLHPAVGLSTEVTHMLKDIFNVDETDVIPDTFLISHKETELLYFFQINSGWDAENGFERIRGCRIDDISLPVLIEETSLDLVESKNLNHI